MGKIFSDNEKYMFDSGETPPFIVELNENNLWGNMHREQPWLDRVAVEDPRDNLAWSWFRADEDPDTFDRMMGVVLEVGSVLIRATAVTDLSNLFDNKHQIQDTEIDELLGGEDVQG